MARQRTVTDEPDIGGYTFTRVLTAVADPIRLSIVRQLAEADEALSCGGIEVPVKASTATHHFAVLRQAGIIHQYYIGTSRMNVLRTAELERLYPGFLPSLIAGANASAA